MQVRAQFVRTCDAAVQLLAAVALIGYLAEVLLWPLVLDGDVDLALGKYEVGDLVVASIQSMHPAGHFFPKI